MKKIHIHKKYIIHNINYKWLEWEERTGKRKEGKIQYAKIRKQNDEQVDAMTITHARKKNVITTKKTRLCEKLKLNVLKLSKLILNGIIFLLMVSE